MIDNGQHAAPQGLNILRIAWDIVVVATAAVLLAWLMTSFVYQAYAVPSGSMEETIMTGDHLFGEKVTYLFRDPQPGEIITFQDPQIPKRTLIKRCVAVGGQVVDLQDGRLIVDGVVIEEPYTHGLPSEPLRTAPGVAITYPFVVPEDHLWVMGDNRTDSSDSRYFGAITIHNISSRAAIIFWPLDKISLL